MQKLFRVSSLINNVIYENRKYDRVVFNWFVFGRKNNDLPYSELVLNYNKLQEKEKKNAEKYLNELFTEEEMKLLKSELDRNSTSITTIEEMKLPVPDHLQPYSAIKPESGKGFSDLTSRKSYNLPFNVRGFFNVNDSYETIEGDDNPTVITRLPDRFLNGKQ